MENALRDSLFGGGWSSVGGGEDDAINESVESARDTDNDCVDISVPKVPVLPPICQHTQDGTNNEGVEEVTPRVPTKNIGAALKRADSLIRAQKTKNSSNKNKERTLIAGAIVWLVERQDLGGGLAANMSMLMMRQLEAMNKSMDKREQREMKQEQRERKERKWQKSRAKKKEKKRAKKAALAGLDDHGGKAGRYSSSSSDSNSSSDDSDSDSDSSLLDQSSNYGHRS
jgi:hypothetical protein